MRKFVMRVLMLLGILTTLLVSASLLNTRATDKQIFKYNVGNLLILGDSYSTFEGYIPSENKTWYPNQENKNDVGKVEETWWQQFIKNTDATLVRNESYSGSTICNTGYGGGFANISFITRFDNLVNDGFFEKNKIDTIIIFGGTNDAWANSPIGEEKYDNWSSEDKKMFLPAFCYLLNQIEENAPNARVVCVINEGIKETIAKGMSNICHEYEVDYVELQNIDKQANHPSVEGMRTIEEQLRGAFYTNETSRPDGVYHLTTYIWNGDTKIKLGDAQQDQKVDVRDLTRIMKHVANEEIEIAHASDINFDKKVNREDVVLFRKQLVGEDQYWSDVY